eukprot:scaffold87652_cov55-Phaeocystis_antarctica.AAC.1
MNSVPSQPGRKEARSTLRCERCACSSGSSRATTAVAQRGAEADESVLWLHVHEQHGCEQRRVTRGGGAAPPRVGVDGDEQLVQRGLVRVRVRGRVRVRVRVRVSGQWSGSGSGLGSGLGAAMPARAMPLP